MFYISVSDLVRVMATSSWHDVCSSSSVRGEGIVVPYFFVVSLYPLLALCLCIFRLRAFCGLKSLQLKAYIA